MEWPDWQLLKSSQACIMKPHAAAGVALGMVGHQMILIRGFDAFTQSIPNREILSAA